MWCSGYSWLDRECAVYLAWRVHCSALCSFAHLFRPELAIMRVKWANSQENNMPQGFLPLRHKVSKNKVIIYSPTLADRALNGFRQVLDSVTIHPKQKQIQTYSDLVQLMREVISKYK